MTDAPEYIWAARNSRTDATMWWPNDTAGATKYIRADLGSFYQEKDIDALMARAEKAEADRDAAIKSLSEEGRKRGYVEAELDRLRERTICDVCGESIARAALSNGENAK